VSPVSVTLRLLMLPGHECFYNTYRRSWRS